MIDVARPSHAPARSPARRGPLASSPGARLARASIRVLCRRVALAPSSKDKTAVTADWYTNNRLPLVLEKVRDKRPHSRILHYDNASPHTTRKTANYLGTLGTELLAHSPRSPDLALCDFYLFSNLKEKKSRKTVYGRRESSGCM
ncbi:Mariner Mos1 transposase [Eumeta japonica]|uniref:Mariner Mos1 transposase n=1 Tax=Eumeta variegata TaxID=151549 RepID=A0A4C1YBS7_EUMVA|nr:Mariner Mos1 transposase [Eumeta japonica]